MTRAPIAVLALSLAVAGAVQAQSRSSSSAPAVGGIYTCVDAKGRTLTADRPIADCNEQVQLNSNGTVKRKVEPSYSAREVAEREDRDRQAQQLAARQQEDRRRERALLMRYPNAAAHDRERSEALVQIDVVIKAAQTRLGELAEERKRIDDELEFYKSDPSKTPDSLRRKLDDNVKSVAVQARFIGEQDEEKRRVNARFDEEQSRLAPLWASNAAAAAATSASK